MGGRWWVGEDRRGEGKPTARGGRRGGVVEDRRGEGKPTGRGWTGQ